METYNLLIYAIKIILTIAMFIIPGISINLLLDKIHDRKKQHISIENFAEIIGISISVNIIAGTIFALAGIFSITSLAIFEALLIIAAISTILISRKKKDVHKKENNEKKTRNEVKEVAHFLSIILLIATICISSFLILKIHTDYSGELSSYSPQMERKTVSNEKYSLPYHGDEWTHIAQSKYLTDNHKLALSNPYFDDEVRPDKITGMLESGFHVLISEIFLLFPEKMVIWYMYLPAIWIIITGLFIFFTIKAIITKTSEDHNNRNHEDYAPHIITSVAIILIAFSKNNVNLIGYWFFIPITVSIGLAMFLFGSYQKRNHIRTSLCFIALSLVYLPAAIIAAMTIIAAHIISERSLSEKNTKREKETNHLKKHQNILGKSTLFVILGAIAIVSIILAAKGFDISSASEYIYNHIIYSTEIFDSNTIYGPLTTLGISAISGLLGLIFAAVLVWKQKYFREHLLFMLIASFFAIGNWIIYNLFGISLFIRYQRNIIIAYVLSAILSGIATHILAKQIIDKIMVKKQKERKEIDPRFHCKKSCLVIAICIIFISTIFAASYSTYQNSEKKEVLYKLIEEKDYLFLKNAEKIIGSDNKIIANRLSSVAVYPVTGNKVVAIAGGNLNSGNYKLLERFAAADCKGKKDILKKNEINYIWITFDAGCEEFEIVLQEGYNRIYDLK